MWGVSFNNSICADMRGKYDGTSDDPLPYDCLEEHEEFIDNEEWGHAMAFEAMTGSVDATFQVGLAEGDTAFVLPGPKYVDMGTRNFIIPTFATRASCTSLNHLCATDSTGAIVNCTSAGFPEFPYYRVDDEDYLQVGWVANRVVGLIDGDIVGLEEGSFESMKTPKNPAQLAVQLQWDELEQGRVKLKGAGAGATTAEDDLAINQKPRPTLFASCNLTFLDAFVQWNSMSQNWTLLNTTASSDEQTSTLWLPLVWQYATEQLAANLMHTARKDNREVVMRALGENIATLALASAAGFFKPGIASDVTQTKKLVVSDISNVPLSLPGVR
ncbi:hypothetical protein FRC00_005175 [Tulasnella sp. 408]|nr:hypothetical protein FRC00_005175 [Tulasnella sp. 408]